MTPNTLTPQQIKDVEAMIARRMDNTGETRSQACAHILAYITNRNA